MLSRLVILSSLGLLSLGAENYEGEIAKIDPELSVIQRGDSLPIENFEHATDPYLEGYIQALIDASYYEFNVIVVVKDHHVTLYNLPHNDLFANSIVSYVQDIPGVQSVEVKKELSSEEMTVRKQYTETPRVSGVWFPQSTVLFLPLVSDPREPVYSVNGRVGDKVVGKKSVAVSLGDDFPIFRWHNVMNSDADLQIGISGGIWAVFNFSDIPNRRSSSECELVNTDYLVGIPVTYAHDRWSFRLRPYHISGHLGDEFMVNHPDYLTKRKNPSFEAIDFISSYQLSSALRVYAGPGIVVHSDPTFRLKPMYAMWGTEVRLLGQKLHYHRLYGTPFFAAHMENWEQHSWDLDMTFKLGYEISKLQGVGRKMRLYLEYHEGFSYEGQFFNEKTKYGQLGLSWGF
ncbi:DUF1207 domain-containing protein [Rhabdochlamydiaceae symbiont of Dictyostelium giganteum]|uniref:DUF1207 domain-containing protein n=1 Tax=Rhabdochlamydiaceae symbiont of Dictyostelium giganteum TaxID=3342349 RepID=UPI0038512B70